jgi:hypothetical protein
MRDIKQTAEVSRTIVIADWADTLLRSARGTLNRVEATVLQAEAKVDVVKRHIAERREVDQRDRTEAARGESGRCE